MSLNFHTAIIAASGRRGGAFDLKDLARYLFDASDASKITDTGGSPNLITDWENSASGANALTRSLAQATTADQPRWDGTKLTFVDTSDHLDFSASVTTPGWVVVGTSRGTFAYRTNTVAWAELALLGRRTNFRTLGDLYGIILLPADASTELIDAARSEMITKGAADGLVGTTMENYFRDRNDMVEFKVIDTSSVTSFLRAWLTCTSLTSFPLLNTSAGTNFNDAWRNCTSLTDFPLLNTAAGTNFNNAWFDCTSLTSFPLLNTAAGTSFFRAWFSCSSLTSFPLLDTSSGTNFQAAWRDCTSLTSFPLLNTAAGTNFTGAWRNCSSLADFPANFFDSWNPASITSGVFNFTWTNCTSLTPASVENILTSLDTSGKYGRNTGLVSGTILADNTIDITYNGSGLTAATTTAITNLKGKDWQIEINGVLQ